MSLLCTVNYSCSLMPTVRLSGATPVHVSLRHLDYSLLFHPNFFFNVYNKQPIQSHVFLFLDIPNLKPLLMEKAKLWRK